MNAIVVVGVGNLIRSDDGLGLHAMQRLAADPRVPQRADAPVTFVDGGTRGLELVNDTADASHVLILDAIESDAEPGTLVSLTGGELASLPAGWSVHQLGIVDWMTALVMLRGDAPVVQVLGLQPARIDWGTTLSPSVEGALGRLVDAAVDQLQEWTAAR